ncbi:hypothetical protein GCM10010232_71100 [Streptomyces amakusaensis]
MRVAADLGCTNSQVSRWQTKVADATLPALMIAQILPSRVVELYTADEAQYRQQPPVTTPRPRDRSPSRRYRGQVVQRCIGRLDYRAGQRTVSKTARPCLFM